MPIRLVSIGILDLTFNITMTESQAENIEFNYNEINSLEDLEYSFFIKNNEDNLSEIMSDKPPINDLSIPSPLFDYVSISSNNSFLNSLLFLNRANKEKTLIEFIMFNEMFFPPEKKFIKKIIQEITERNYLYLLEYNFKDDIPTKINLKIRIIEDDINEEQNEIYIRSFELFESNCEVNCELLKNQSFFFLLTIFDFSHDYFYADFDTLILLKKLQLEEINLFLELLVNKFPKIKIIMSFPTDLVGTSTDVSKLNFTKEILEFSDILFIETATMKKFYSVYFDTFNKHWDKRKLEIISDRDKKRKSIPRTTLAIDMEKKVDIIVQSGYNLNVTEHNEMCLLIFSESERYSDKFKENIDLFKSILIGAFLSRFLHEKSLNTCLTAANLAMKKMFNIFKYNIEDQLINKDYEVIVPCSKKILELREEQKKNEILKEKESKFILDCVNKQKSQKPEYNPLLDTHCERFFGSKSKRTQLKQLKLIGKYGNVLKDPGMSFSKSPEEKYRNKIGKAKRSLMKTFGDNLIKNNFNSNNNNTNMNKTISDNEYINASNYDSSGNSSTNIRKSKPKLNAYCSNYKVKNAFYEQNNNSFLPKVYNNKYENYDEKSSFASTNTKKNIFLKSNGFSGKQTYSDFNSTQNKFKTGDNNNISIKQEYYNF